jgi:hypothetical protein
MFLSLIVHSLICLTHDFNPLVVSYEREEFKRKIIDEQRGNLFDILNWRRDPDINKSS